MKSNHDREKRYYEFLAKTILEQFCPSEFKDIRIQDKPDLLNYNNHGIEVTRSMFPGAGESSSLFQRLRGKAEDEVDPRTLERFKSLGNELSIYKGRIMGYCPEAQWCTLGELQEAFSKKLKKIDAYSPSVSLFIFSPLFDWYDMEMMTEYTEWAIQAQKHAYKQYSSVFVFQTYELFVCDLKTGEVKDIKISREEIGQCCQSALEYANNRSSP